MKINPVYGKEIKLRVRSLKFAMTILFFNLVLIAIALLGFEMSFNVNWNSTIDYSGAAIVYWIIICLESAMVAFLVPVFTAGSIAGEREKQTLEILLTTVLKPRQIIFGKLMSSISMVVLLVFSSLPVISIVFTIGGITMFNILQFVIFIGVMSFFIGSMGMFASAFVKKAIPATVLSLAMVMIVCGLTAVIVLIANIGANIYYYNVLGGGSNVSVPDVSWASYFLLVNPAFTLFQLIFSQYWPEDIIGTLGTALNGNIPPFISEHWFICSIAVQLVLTFVFLKLATRFLDPLRHSEKAKKEKKGKRRKKERKSGDIDDGYAEQ